MVLFSQLREETSHIFFAHGPLPDRLASATWWTWAGAESGEDSLRGLFKHIYNLLTTTYCMKITHPSAQQRH